MKRKLSLDGEPIAQNNATKKARLTESEFSDFEILDQVGEGTYGVVLRAKYRPTGRIVAIKRVKTEVNEGEGISSTTIREVSLLKALSHPNIITLHACIANSKHIWLIFEYMEMDLKKYLESTNPSQLQIQAMTIALLSGVNYCLKNGIYHRDLKPQNILVNNDGKVKIADFGLGREVLFNAADPITPSVVTLWYRCPELLLGAKVYGYGVDSWALGCIIGEFFNKKPLFHGNSEIEQLFHIFEHLGTPTEQTWKDFNLLKHYSNQFPRWKEKHISAMLKDTACAEVIDMIGGLLKLDPRSRITPKTALKHSYCKMNPTQLEALDSANKDNFSG